MPVAMRGRTMPSIKQTAPSGNWWASGNYTNKWSASVAALPPIAPIVSRLLCGQLFQVRRERIHVLLCRVPAAHQSRVVDADVRVKLPAALVQGLHNVVWDRG